MPVFNLSIDDTSPLIHYEPLDEWHDSSLNDPSVGSYLNHSFHATESQNANATISFNGSAVYVFGAFGPNHDAYTVTLDRQSTTYNGSSGAGPALFQQLMFSATDLSTEESHTLTVENNYTTSMAWVDIDFIVITSGDGNTASQLHDTVLDDDDSSIAYSEGWDNSSNSWSQTYYEETMHRTSQAGASATISFVGNAISVYGATSGNHGEFAVSLDGGLSTSFDGSARKFRPQILLYYAANLSNGLHMLNITNTDTSGKFLDLDKVVISKWEETNSIGQTNSSSSTISLGSPSSSSSTATSLPAFSKSNTPVGPIIGGTIAGIIALMLISLAIFFLLRRRRSQKVASSSTYISQGPTGGTGPISDYPFSSKAAREPYQSFEDMKVDEAQLPDLPPYGYTKT
ncbi:hypothetical protein BDY19DRAFT_683874 [Irpex rosettiformis]|uniref:Uncharacterized protein n=1 Tax=Irpex rosettiformis TaxID=378272 RepID=A0ACB8U9P6_9APHY|nr:hypothetical protein BDY19DRAFT_683874 [Irpex rosettiformis]